MSRLLAGRPGSLSAQAKAAAALALVGAPAVISGVGLRRKDARSASDKAYALETRLNALGFYSDTSGRNRYLDAQGNACQSGTTRQFINANQTINSATPQSLGFSYTVVSGGTYRIIGMFFAVQGSVNSGQFFGWTGPATSFCRIGISFGNTTTNAQNAWTNVSGLGASGFGWSGAAGNGVELFYFGTVTFSAGGTFQPYGQCSNAANTFTMQSGTSWDVSQF